MRSLKVLVLEDSPFRLMAIHQMLNASGVYDVLTADNIHGARGSLTRRGAVDIAICNVQMEEGDTRNLIEHLAKNRLAQAIILLGCSGQARLDLTACHARSLGLEVLASLPKPAPASVLHSLLEQYSLGMSTPGGSTPLAQVEEMYAHERWPSERQLRRLR